MSSEDAPPPPTERTANFYSFGSDRFLSCRPGAVKLYKPFHMWFYYRVVLPQCHTFTCSISGRHCLKCVFTCFSHITPRITCETHHRVKCMRFIAYVFVLVLVFSPSPSVPPSPPTGLFLEDPSPQ